MTRFGWVVIGVAGMIVVGCERELNLGLPAEPPNADDTASDTDTDSIDSDTATDSDTTDSSTLNIDSDTSSADSDTEYHAADSEEMSENRSYNETMRTITVPPAYERNERHYECNT
ncbi:MAG: hypothetical protein JXX29_22140 [Deltaproteobacteria bacterium]|nr:hypothetical protein [Deltaproteobacteria bacterium]